ncbi:MAG: PAS domain-containing protein [Hyphomicrobiales bacterium]
MPQQRLADVITLSDKLDLAIFILEVGEDETFIFRKLNPSHETISGLKSADLEGKTPFDVLPPRMADNVQAKYLTCLRSRAPLTYEEVLQFPTGETWWQTTLSPMIFDDGRVIGIVGTAVDITVRKQQEFRDAKALADLRKLNEEINTYTSMAAHDVRGPLRKIKVITELLFADMADGSEPDAPLTLGAEQKVLASSIGQIADSTLQHVDSILSYARALEMPRDATLEPVDLGMLFADLTGLVDAAGSFHFDYPNETVIAERIILQITLRNLLENAVKFGKARCKISLSVSEEAPEFLRFVASDDGPGFSDGAILSDQSAQSRLQSPTSGFGLDSAQRMIESRGGKVWLADPALLPESAQLGGAHVAFTTRGSISAGSANAA